MAEFKNPIRHQFDGPEKIGKVLDPYDLAREGLQASVDSPYVGDVIKHALEVVLPEQAVRTVVTPLEAEIKIAEVKNAALRLSTTRLPPSEELFTATTNGDLFWRVPGLEAVRQQHFDLIGGFAGSMLTGLDERRAISPKLESIGLETVTALVNLPEGGLIVETGAGADYKRITALWDHATQRNGHLVCHDIPLAAASAARGEIPETVPYVSVAPGKEYFGSLLHSEAPVVVTLHNVISTFGLDDARTLLDNCRSAGVERVVVSQALKLASASRMFPYGHDLQDSTTTFDANLIGLINHITPSLLGTGWNTQEILKGVQVMGLQAKESIGQILLESMVSAIRGLGTHKYGYNVYTASITNSEDLPFEDAEMRLAQNGLSMMLRVARNNHVRLGFAESCAFRDSEVPPGMCRITGERLYMVLSKDSIRDPFADVVGRVRKISAGDQITPGGALTLTPHDIATHWPDVAVGLDESKIAQCAAFGRRFAVNYVGQVLKAVDPTGQLARMVPDKVLEVRNF